jgi:ribose 5-phosphate isomerase B
MKNNIALGSDHAGFVLKNLLADWLAEKGFQINDCGTFSQASCDYPDYARCVARAVSTQQAHYGILVCGSGIGVSIVANKVRRVRAALVQNVEQAMLARQHNDANVLCLGARFLTVDQAKEILEAWLATAFEGGRHAKRVDKIEEPRAGEELPV